MGLTRFQSRSTEGDPELTEEDETLLHRQAHTQLYFDLQHSEGTGTLYITTKRVIWLDADTQRPDHGYSIDYHSILMHAISRDQQVFEQSAIYCQLDQAADDDDDEHDNDDGMDDEDDESNDVDDVDVSDMTRSGKRVSKIFELRLVPDDEAAGRYRTTVDHSHTSRIHQ